MPRPLEGTPCSQKCSPCSQSRTSQETAATTQAALLGSPCAVMNTMVQGVGKGYHACAQELMAVMTIHLVPFRMAVLQEELVSL